MTRFHAVLAVIILAAMLCLVMMANAVFAAMPEQRCVSVNTVKSDLVRAIPGSVIADMGGTEAAAFLTAFNAVPPVSQFTADYFVIVSDETMPNVLVVMFDKGCFKRMFPVPKAIFHSMMRSL